jgi:WD40 repeat protein
MKGHKQGVNSLDFNRNNINLISGSRDKKIIIWGLINYEMIKVIDSEV